MRPSFINEIMLTTRVEGGSNLSTIRPAGFRSTHLFTDSSLLLLTSRFFLHRLRKAEIGYPRSEQSNIIAAYVRASDIELIR